MCDGTRFDGHRIPSRFGAPRQDTQVVHEFTNWRRRTDVTWWEWAAAIALAAVLAYAGVAKIAGGAFTAKVFSDLGLPGGRRLPAIIAVFELMTAVALVIDPQGGASVALLLLGAFTLFLFVRLVSRRGGECACFGGAARITWWSVARNLGLMALALVVVGAG